jgi:quinoprotein glucose dehydrogenase
LRIGGTERAAQDAACRSRIFMGTNDVRVIALDARTGAPCADFGGNGEVKLDIGMKLEWPGEFQITSAPRRGARRGDRRLGHQR